VWRAASRGRLARVETAPVSRARPLSCRFIVLSTQYNCSASPPLKTCNDFPLLLFRSTSRSLAVAYQSPISLVMLENSPNGLSSASYPLGCSSSPIAGAAMISLGVSMPGVELPVRMDGDPAWAWMRSSRLSRSTDLESRKVRKLIASMPFDSAGMI